MRLNYVNYLLVAGQKASAEKLKVKYARGTGVKETIFEVTYILNDEYYIIFEPLLNNSYHPSNLTDLITFYDENENDITSEFWYKKSK